MVVTDAPRNAIPGFTRYARTAVPGALALLPLLALPLLTVARSLLPAAGSVAIPPATGLRLQNRGRADRGKYQGDGGDCQVHGGIHRHREVLWLKA